MDTASGLGITGGSATILFIAYRIFLWVNHRSFKSRCCGKMAEIGIDVDTPPQDLKINIPKEIPEGKA